MYLTDSHQFYRVETKAFECITIKMICIKLNCFYIIKLYLLLHDYTLNGVNNYIGPNLHLLEMNML